MARSSSGLRKIPRTCVGKKGALFLGPCFQTELPPNLLKAPNLLNAKHNGIDPKQQECVVSQLTKDTHSNTPGTAAAPC